MLVVLLSMRRAGFCISKSLVATIKIKESLLAMKVGLVRSTDGEFRAAMPPRAAISTRRSGCRRGKMREARNLRAIPLL
tara:strand:+ start:426 stop:662 length:237 start_codon:yes stop_codon:yes gene_type:complete